MTDEAPEQPTGGGAPPGPDPDAPTDSADGDGLETAPAPDPDAPLFAPPAMEDVTASDDYPHPARIELGVPAPRNDDAAESEPD
jgi:hypothetical protein